MCPVIPGADAVPHPCLNNSIFAGPTNLRRVAIMNRSFASHIELVNLSGSAARAGERSKRESGKLVCGRLLSLVWLAVMVLFATSSGFSQETSSLTGTAKDQTGLAVPTATITLTNAKTAEVKKTAADATGGYSFTGLAAGSYTIGVTAPGFAAAQQAVSIPAGEAVTADIALMIAGEVQSVSVSGETDPYNVVPAQETNAAFGLPEKIEDIPRTVSNADSEMLNLYSARTVNDLVVVVPGSFTGAYFGIPGSVFLRGDIADNYFRGFRRVENRGNYETPVSAADHIEIVEGPPSPIYGPGRIGGFMNFYPKTVRSEGAKWLDKGQGALQVRFGEFSDNVGSAEYGLPFKVASHRAGAYVFFEDKDSGSFYKGVFDKYKVGQLAVDMELSPKWRLAYGFQGFNEGGIQALGWNRVTQDLIDHQNYLSGSPAVNLSSNGKDIGPQDIAPGQLNTFAFQQDMGAVFPYYSNSVDYALDPATVHMVKLPRNQILVDDANDFLHATTYTAYFDVVGDLKPGVTFKNQSFFDRLNSQKFSSYGFGADYRPWTVENKSTLSFSWHPNSVITMNAFSGFDYTRLQVSAGEERDDYQVVDRRDISVGATANDRMEGPWTSNPRIPFQYLNIGLYSDYGLFWLSNIDFWNRLVVTIGARYDRDSPDFWGRDSGYGALTHETASNNAGMLNGSVSYRLPFQLNPYFTVATSRFLDLGQGNEIDASEIPNGTYIEPSSLYEAGIKSNQDHKFYGALSLYRQKRSQWNSQTISLDYFKSKGAELELRAFLAKRISLTGAFTWQEPQELNAPFLLAIPPTLLGLTPEQGYGGKFEGVATIFPHTGAYQVAGQPHWVASPFGTVNVTKNIGVLVGTTWVAAVRAGYVSPIILPSYSVWRGSVFYRREKYQVNFGINNMFDATYFQSQYLFEDSLVKPGEGRYVGGTVKYTF
jgi:iron complex outermembrane receptor protein